MTRAWNARASLIKLSAACLCALAIPACGGGMAARRPIPPERSQPRWISYRPIFGILPERPPRGLYPAGYAGGNVLAERTAVLVEPAGSLPPPAFGN